jgi:uncharacterized integral membrane protein
LIHWPLQRCAVGCGTRGASVAAWDGNWRGYPYAVGDDVERNAVGDSSGLPADTGRADERAATAPVYRGTGLSVALVIAVAMTVLAIVLAAQNTENTTVEVFAANYRAPLIVVILAAVITGVILDEVFGFFWRHHRRHRLAERAELRRLRRSQ